MIERAVTAEEVQHHMNTTKNAKEYRRWQVLYMTRIQKIKVTHVAKSIAISRTAIYDILKRFDLHGSDGMATKPTGGRLDSYMSLEEEKDLMEAFVKSGTDGMLITAKNVKQAAEEKLRMPVSIYYAYDLLHRNGWRKIKPRPKHPKSSKEEQEEFKKKFHHWSKNA